MTQETQTTGSTVDAKVEVKVDPPGSITKLSSPNPYGEQWTQILDQIRLYLSQLPDFLGEFFDKNQKPLLTVGLVVAAFVAVKVTLAVIDSLNDIPLLSPTFELIGISYTGWFIYRYLLRASSRQELSKEIQSLKAQVLGNVTPKN
jgi:hypothetical protein